MLFHFIEPDKDGGKTWFYLISSKVAFWVGWFVVYSEWKRRHTCWYFACISFLMIPASSVCTDMYPRKQQHSSAFEHVHECRILLQFNTHLAVPPARSHHTSHRDLIPMERRKKSLLLFPQHHTLQYLLFSGLETEFSNFAHRLFPLMLMYSDI